MHVNDTGGTAYGQRNSETNFNNTYEHEKACAKMVSENPLIFSWKTNIIT
jgi:hypothetical protein